MPAHLLLRINVGEAQPETDLYDRTLCDSDKRLGSSLSLEAWILLSRRYVDAFSGGTIMSFTELCAFCTDT